MRQLLAAAAALALAAGASVPKFTVNLDLPPEDRYTEATHYFRRHWLAIANNPDDRKLQPAARRAWLKAHHVPREYLAELRGIVRDINDSRITVDRLLLRNLLYSLNYPRFCSGVLMADANGQVTQGRNLDYEIYGNFIDGRPLLLKDTLHELTYVKGGKPLFVSIALMGQVGVHTAMTLTEPRWSFQQNTHQSNDQGRNLRAAQKGGVEFGTFARGLMEQGIDFSTAVQRMERTKFDAPQYFIMAGQRPWEGAVLEILRDETPGEAENNVAVLSPQINRWFLMQTNDRLWDTAEDERRPKGVSMLTSLGQSRAGPDAVLATLRQPLIFNPRTVYTFITVPATGYYNLVMHDDTPPSQVAQLSAAVGRHIL